MGEQITIEQLIEKCIVMRLSSHDGKIKDLTHKRTKSRRRQTEEAEEKANLFENRFRSGGEENERRMANNVMQEMKVYDGYLVCLDLV